MVSFIGERGGKKTKKKPIKNIVDIRLFLLRLQHPLKITGSIAYSVLLYLDFNYRFLSLSSNCIIHSSANMHRPVGCGTQESGPFGTKLPHKTPFLAHFVA